MIAVRGLAAAVGGFALRDVTFTVPAGEYGVVIGPAGAGKTTLLETIAGITRARAGSVQLGGEDVTHAAPNQRRIGFVYQQGYLFPHLTAGENAAYGAADPATVSELAERLDIGSLLRRTVRSLSGGEQQLVAIARALATRPPVLLLDEPFSALDPRRRALARRVVRELHTEWGMTVLQVTHDFAEAGLLGDVAVLIDGGRVLQFGPPDRIFRAPASPYVAEFLGAENILAGVVARLPDAPPDVALEIAATEGRDGPHALVFRAGPLTFYTVGDAPDGPAYAVIRAEEVMLAHELHESSVRNWFHGTVAEVATLGALTRVTVDVDGMPLVAALTTRSAREMDLAPGAGVYASCKAMAVHLC